MGSLSKQAYLAAKYMSGPKAEAILANAPKSNSSRKRKRKSPQPSCSSAFVLQDNDAPWSSTLVSQNNEDDDESVPPTNATFSSDRGFKDQRRDADGSGWETIRAPTPPPPDEQPLVVEPENPRTTGGILSKSALSKLRPEASASSMAEQVDTVYRDASGRKIDTKAEKAAAARQKRLQEEKEAQKMEWGKGLVQREEDEQKRKELELQRTKDVSRCDAVSYSRGNTLEPYLYIYPCGNRYANDAELNEVQKKQNRWNDPAAAFLSVSYGNINIDYQAIS